MILSVPLQQNCQYMGSNGLHTHAMGSFDTESTVRIDKVMLLTLQT